MFSVQTKFLFVPTSEARTAIRGLVKLPRRRGLDGRLLPPHDGAIERATTRLVAEVAKAAFREVAVAGKGFEIAHLQFVFRGLTMAVSSRVRKDGVIEIEAGLGDPALGASMITEAQLKAAEGAARVRGRLAERQRILSRRAS